MIRRKRSQPGARLTPSLEYQPLTPERWPDLERLFGANGASAGCWCMWWRQPRAEFQRRKGEPNRTAFRGLVRAGPPPGVLAYADGEPVAWCALAPRDTYPRLDRSRILAPVDDKPVWSVVCFFVSRPWRDQDVTVPLLRAAVKHARAHGARIVEGYPIELGKGRMADAFAWTGFASTFRRAGFREVLRRSETRPIMRYLVRR